MFMSACPKCGNEPEGTNNSRVNFLKNRRGKVDAEKQCKFCN